MTVAGIQTGIELNDQFSGVLNSIVASVNLAVSAMADMQSSMNADIDTSSLEGARDEINQATAALNAMEDAMQRQTAPDIQPPTVDQGNQEPISVPVEPVIPDPLVENPEPIRPEIQPNAPPEIDPVQVPIEWQSDGLDVFTGTGIERFEQEVQSANSMLNELNNVQTQINATAGAMDVLPDNAQADITAMTTRIQNLQTRIQQIANNPVNLGTDEANAGLEQLRSQLNSAIQSQNDLNSALENMDVEAANQAYLQLSNTVSNTERYIRDNTNEQGTFNNAVDDGVVGMNNLENAIQKVVTAIGGMFAIQKVIGWINDCTDAAATQTKAETQLATTIANMGGNEKDYDALVQKAAEIQQLGMYGDEAMIGAAAEFATYMSDTSAVELMMDTLTDYAAGMSGGGAIDYNSMVDYATNLGKITTGAYDAMTKKGFEFTDAQKAVIDGSATQQQYLEALGEGWETMTEDMRSATIIADIIGESWSDMYENMSQTPEAQLIALKNAFGDIQENVGNRLNATLGNLWSTLYTNLPQIEAILMSGADALNVIIAIIDNLIQLAVEFGSFVSENWSIISPIIYGIVAALAVYAAYLAIVKGIELASAAASAIHSVAMSAKIGIMAALTGSTMAATAAQMGYNGALYACPIVWIIMLIIALIAVIFAVCSAIAKMTGIANSGFGVITGGVNVVIQFFKNLGLTVANIALGIGNAIAALASNMMTAFHNAICSVQAWFYDLLSDALTVIAGIAAALNKLPFVSFDYSGITSAADDYAAKSAEAANNKEAYTSVSDAFKDGMSTFDTFQDGWAADAFNAGAEWGDGVADAVSNFSLSDMLNIPSPTESDYSSIFANSGVSDGVDDIASNTGAIKDSMDITEEDLKYLRDIAEQEAVNRFTTAEISIDMSGMQNTIQSGDDIDGFMDKLTDSVNEAVDGMTEGVHE